VKAHGRRAAAKMDVRVRLSAELVALPLAGAVETSSKMTGGGEDGGGDEALWRPRVESVCRERAEVEPRALKVPHRHVALVHHVDNRRGHLGVRAGVADDRVHHRAA
jgi:hypothetical protein